MWILAFIVFILAISVCLIYFKEKKIMLDLTQLIDEVDAITAIIPGIASDYAQLKAAIEDLQGQIDPEAQEKVDALVAKLDTGFAALKQLDDSIVPPEPEPV